MDLIDRLYDFYFNFNGEKGIIGYTEKGHPIVYFRRGFGNKKIIVQASIHAREYITTFLTLKLIEEEKIKKGVSVYYVPCVNIDGVKITKILPTFKANANGVDLNTNFPAKFNSGAKNTNKRGGENFTGLYPMSESETRSLIDFTKKIHPDLTISFHAKGEEIYYDFFNEKLKKEHYPFALIAKEVTGYKIIENLKSAGGYKDWCIESQKIPSLTIEVGSDNLVHPIGEEYLGDIYIRIKGLIYKLSNKLLEKK